MHKVQTVVTDMSGVCHADALLGLTVRGHLVQTLPNHLGFLFLVVFIVSAVDYMERLVSIVTCFVLSGT